jgi:tether containing UBX domain for GLUT4
MASHVVVTDTSLRTHKIAVQPGTLLVDVKKDACRKSKLDPDNYGLKRNSKQLDLSLSIRQSGLTSGARLELVVASKSPSVVSVKLQLPDGTSLVDKVASNTSLWHILRRIEVKEIDKNLNFTARGVARTDAAASGAGQIYYEAPVLNVLGVDHSGYGELQKNLGQLGITNNISMRLTYKVTDQTLTEAMSEIQQTFPETEAATEVVDKDTGAHAMVPTPLQQARSNENTASPVPGSPPRNALPLTAATEGGEEPGIPASVTSSPPSADSRNIQIFAAPTSSTPVAATIDVPEPEPTLADLQRLKHRLEQQTVNKKLLSDRELEEIEKQRQAKREAVDKISVKIRFPDQTFATATFSAADTGATLYEVVRNMIVAEKEPFKLFYTDDKGRRPAVPDSTKVKLIQGLNWTGNVLVNLHWDDGVSAEAKKGPSLKQEFGDKAQKLVVPTVDIDTGADSSEAGPSKPAQEQPEKKKLLPGKKPSWLKVGKK